MSANRTLLIDTLLARLSSAEAKVLLDQIDKLIAQETDRFLTEESTMRRRRADNFPYDTPANTTSNTLKDAIS